ncbi:hypothetical protein BCIN_01g00900 [Botrytis cinerea B05.10]|uniref:Uncharacterized protein n=1 Tax=Botryotinia fuckeliana (strain B05.10) TaxID=332648 RepID=A0A384J443_BOTFB|nr:hypothetical protein BCIN_01g00900 [Botrytis cinerea B05.10]ATZ45280.1 hypothetical protein BCIN_01g00900 [Botrytis cinerea B05.10]
MHYLSFRLVSFLICLAPWNVLSAPTYQYLREPQTNEVFASRDYFYVGGEYVTTSTNNTLFVNQMYVEHLLPSLIEQPYPIVFIHGQSMTGTIELAQQTRWVSRMGNLFLIPRL